MRQKHSEFYRENVQAGTADINVEEDSDLRINDDLSLSMSQPFPAEQCKLFTSMQTSTAIR